jgi:hypothetical protein
MNPLKVFGHICWEFCAINYNDILSMLICFNCGLPKFLVSWTSIQACAGSESVITKKFTMNNELVNTSDQCDFKRWLQILFKWQFTERKSNAIKAGETLPEGEYDMGKCRPNLQECTPPSPLLYIHTSSALVFIYFGYKYMELNRCRNLNTHTYCCEANRAKR